MRNARRRAAGTLLVVPLLLVTLSACGAASYSGNDLDSGRPGSSPVAAEETVGPDANLGGMDYQARQLSDSLPQFSPLTHRPVGGTAVGTGSSTSPSTGTLDACNLVTAGLLDRDLGIDVTATAVQDASSFGDPDARDCYYGDANGIVVAQATTRAGSDLSTTALSDPSGQPGETAAVPGADRGYAYVPDPSATSGAAALVVVVGGRGLDIALTAAQSISLDQVVRLGTDLAGALR